MDGCGGYLVLFALVAGVIYVACKIRAANVAAELRREDAELQRTHPEVWRQKELLKLEKERLERRRSWPRVGWRRRRSWRRSGPGRRTCGVTSALAWPSASCLGSW